MSESAFPALTKAQQVFKDLVWEPLILLGETALFTWEAPVATIPVVGYVVTESEKLIIGKATDWLFHQFVLLIDITAIKWVNAEHQAAYDKASESLWIVATDFGPTSPEYLKAKEDAKKALVDFIRPIVG